MEDLDGKKAVLIMWPATWMTRWKPADREWWENRYKDHREAYENYCDGYGSPLDRGYFDEKGDHHLVLASGFVIVEKLGDEDERMARWHEERQKRYLGTSNVDDDGRNLGIKPEDSKVIQE